MRLIVPGLPFVRHSTMSIIDALPEIRFTADFSHWCCVHNSLLQDQQDSVNRVIERSDYIHARVGSATSPQITDPRAPDWKEAVETHVRWWERIAEHHKNNNSEFLPICSEFGPPEYMVTLPSTGKPIADQWDINCYMKEMLKERLRHLGWGTWQKIETRNCDLRIALSALTGRDFRFTIKKIELLIVIFFFLLILLSTVHFAVKEILWQN